MAASNKVALLKMMFETMWSTITSEVFENVAKRIAIDGLSSA